MAYQIGKKITENLAKVEVNDFGDYIMLNPSDNSLKQKYVDLLKWAETRQRELDDLAEQKDKQYEGREMFTHDEEGNLKEVDIEQLADLVEVELNFCKEAEEKINDLFGQDTLKKYLRACYEINPNYIPDTDAIADFFEEITPVMSSVFGTRFERIKSRYNKNRKGKNTNKVVPIEK